MTRLSKQSIAFSLAAIFAIAFPLTLVAQEKAMLGQFPSQNSEEAKAQSSKRVQKAPYKLAQQTTKPDSGKKLDQKQLASKKPKQPVNVSNARRKEMIAFFKTHHPELQRLVSLLQKTRPTQYQTTLRSLDREVRSLQSQEAKSPERYKKSLQLWKVSTDIRVQTAHLARKQKPEEKEKIRKQLRTLIAKKHDLRVEQMRVDFDAQTKRMEKIRKQLADLEGDRDNLIARQMESLDNSAKRISTQHRKTMEAKKKKQTKADAAKEKSKKPDQIQKNESKPKKDLGK